MECSVKKRIEKRSVSIRRKEKNEGNKTIEKIVIKGKKTTIGS